MNVRYHIGRFEEIADRSPEEQEAILENARREVFVSLGGGRTRVLTVLAMFLGFPLVAGFLIFLFRDAVAVIVAQVGAVFIGPLVGLSYIGICYYLLHQQDIKLLHKGLKSIMDPDRLQKQGAADEQ